MGIAYLHRRLQGVHTSLIKGCIRVGLVPGCPGPEANLVVTDKSATEYVTYWHVSLHANNEATWVRLTKGMELPSGRLRFGTVRSSFAILTESKLASAEVSSKRLTV